MRELTEVEYKVMVVANALEELKTAGIVTGGYTTCSKTKELLRQGKAAGYVEPTDAEIAGIMQAMQSKLEVVDDTQA